MNLILPVVKKALENFVFADEVAEVLSLAIVTKKPVILFGPGGFGKSEMVRAVFEALKQERGWDYGIQSFGEGMNEARLYGGIDMKAMNCSENPRIIYNVENSFLAKEMYLLEEMLDANVEVLLSLKDTLTSRQLNNGEQTYEMKTLFLVAATNKNPIEINEMGPTYQALMDRFAIRHYVEWKDFKKESFMKMFTVSDKNTTVTVSDNLKMCLASLIEETHESGHYLNPRAAMSCLDCIRGSALLNNRKEAIEEDLMGIKYIPGTESLLSGLSDKLELVKRVAFAQKKFDEYKKDIDAIRQRMEQHAQNKKGEDRCRLLLQQSNSLRRIADNIYDIGIPDSMVRLRDELRNAACSLADQATETARNIA